MDHALHPNPSAHHDGTVAGGCGAGQQGDSHNPVLSLGRGEQKILSQKEPWGWSLKMKQFLN